MQRDIRNSACPHDCPSTCALEIEVLDGKRIGAVRGAEANSYTAGVICAKVARYAERIHHPDRLTQTAAAHRPEGLRPVPADLLGRGAGSRGGGIRSDGRPAWRRGGVAVLLRRHDGTGAARRHQPAAPRHALFPAGQDDLHVDLRGRLDGRRRPLHRTGPARDGALRPDRDVGRQPGVHPGQRDDAYRARTEGARREAGGGRSVSHRHRCGGGHASGAAARHRWRAGLRGDACRVPRRLCRSRLSWRGSPIVPAGLEAHLAARVARNGRRRSPACRSQQIEDFARLYCATQRSLYPHRLRLRALAQRRGDHARGDLPADGHRQVAARRRRRAVEQSRHLQLGQDADRGPGRDRSDHAHPGHEPARQRADRRSRRRCATARRCTRC